MKIKWTEEKQHETENKMLIEDVNINSKLYDVELSTAKNDAKNFFISFISDFYNNGDKDMEFCIWIIDNKIRFRRHRHRPNHDHNNLDDLCFNKETGKFAWLERPDSEYKLVEIDFGGVEDLLP